MGLNVKETVFNVTAYRLLPWTVADKVVGIIGFCRKGLPGSKGDCVPSLGMENEVQNGAQN